MTHSHYGRDEQANACMPARMSACRLMILFSVSEDGYVEGGALEMLSELCHDGVELGLCEVGLQGVEQAG